MNETRQNIVDARRRLDMSQAELAEAAGISQSTVSRVETGDQDLTVQLLGKLARALKVELKDLSPSDELSGLLSADRVTEFFHLCPHPFCRLNKLQRSSDGKAQLYWTSSAKSHISEFGDTNFCSQCGTGLIKNCPSCEKILTSYAPTYCVRCGATIVNRPTTDEWKKIELMLPKEEKGSDDDLPF